MRNDEHGQKPCSKRSPGFPGIVKRRKISKYWSTGLVAVRGGGLGSSPRYAMHERNLRSPDFFAVREAFLGIWSRYATNVAVQKSDLLHQISCKKKLFLLLASISQTRRPTHLNHHLNSSFKPFEAKDRTRDHHNKLNPIMELKVLIFELYLVNPCVAEQKTLIVLLVDTPFAGRIASPLV
ncbi:hypothetical protein E3N88_29220 [Mikania micrantha]|uniref:Uncharacterized protein n=1 Tax=Mikania micrantha TaxID=192012 RepID=A0A5N6MK97_9ASTR|nr:hypothetical protein E3N88_29220 [Mikania micrantha]